jgi:hypothetical protein
VLARETRIEVRDTRLASESTGTDFPQQSE